MATARSGCWSRSSGSRPRFVLDNDVVLVPLLVAHLQEYLERMQLCHGNGRFRIGVALEMDEVTSNETGNQITLVRRRPAPRQAS